jgi:indole-3-glycerol phosphate synthase/phosphoribosylanthranilate isomerase
MGIGHESPGVATGVPTPGGFLTQIIAAKRAQVLRERRDISVASMREEALAVRASAKPLRLRAALAAGSSTPAIIAEFKRTSPSAGVIRSDVDVREIVRAYERGGASAISILTDEEHFGGSMADLVAARAETSLPILRKDFVVDPAQIFAAAIAGADAILLIVAALDDTSLQSLRETAEEELGLDALVEAHTAEEVRRATRAGARLIGVNNRDLHTLRVSLETSERLITEMPRGAIMISESGLSGAADLRRLGGLGYRGFLIGEILMRAADPAAKLRELVQSFPDRTDAASEPSNSIMGPAQIKICGITRLEDVRVCLEMEVDMIGLNFWPGSSRYVAPQKMRSIRSAIGAEAEGVGVFVRASLDDVRRLARELDLGSVQLHGDYSPTECAELAREFRVIRALPLTPEFQPEEAAAFPDCDVLLDTAYDDLEGGGGERCDWDKARAAARFARFSLLAGGLTPVNVREAIEAVEPGAVDVCSGVEREPGVKDPRLIRQFVSAVRGVATSLRPRMS